jgi:hypothetical protein
MDEAVINNRFLATVIARIDDNGAIFKRIPHDEHIRQALIDLYTDCAYHEAGGSR